MRSKRRAARSALNVRFRWICAVASIAISLTPVLAAATAEGMLTIVRFELESPGVGESGPVTVSGTQSQIGITSLTIHAFGKVLVLSPSQLKAIAGFPANGIAISYAMAPEKQGGRTIYVSIAKEFTSGVISRRLISVTERGGVMFE